MGQRRGLASTDTIKLNRMYKCHGQKPTAEHKPQPGQTNVGTNQGSGFGGSNWGFYPQQAASFIRQLASYFFQRNPRQGDEYSSSAQNDEYGFNGQNGRYGFNGPSGPYGGYGF